MAGEDNQHFVPQFYFRGFSQDGRSICALIRRTGKTVAKASIRKQASDIGFYGDPTVEKALSDVEGECAGALRELVRLQNPELLSPEHYTLVLVWLNLQRSRTMAARRMSQPMHDKFTRLQLEMAIGHATDLDDAKKRELLGRLDEVEADPIPLQLIEMKIAMELSASLSDLRPLVLLNRTTRPFVFGDAPVVFYNGLCRDVKIRGVLGTQSSGLMVFFPLTPEAALVLLDDAHYEVKRGCANQVQVRDLRDVASLNKLQLHAASTCLYFSNPLFASYVADLWRQEVRALKDPAGIVVQAPGFAIETGESMGEIVHSFQPQLPYRLNLSFIRHEVLGDGDRRDMRRATYR